MGKLVSSMQHQLVSVEKGYDLWAPTYDLNPNPLLAAEERVLKPLLKGVSDKIVLDVGCGTGRWLEKLLGAGARSGIGVDLSCTMLSIAQSKPAVRGFLVRGNCLALPFPSLFADLIVSSFVLGHISGIETFAQELARVAKCRADLWVTDVHPEARAKGWTTGFRHQHGSAEIATYLHPPQHICDSFQKRHFVVSEFREVRIDEAEKPIFERAGKSHQFHLICEVPAICIWRFERRCS